MIYGSTLLTLRTSRLGGFSLAKASCPNGPGTTRFTPFPPTPSTPLRNSRPRRLPQPVDRLLPLLHATGKACPSKIAQRLKLSKGFGSPVHQSRRFGVSLLIGTSHSSESIYRAGHKPGRIADVEAGPLDTASVGGLL